MSLSISSVVTICVILWSGTLSAQRMPTGQYHSNRERHFDLIHYKAELSFDFTKKEVHSTASLLLAPLHKTNEITLDALALKVEKVSIAGRETDFSLDSGSLVVQLPEEKAPSDTFSVVVAYTATPEAGMYFVADPQDPELFFVATYGEDGLHANWLPVYSDVNDRFSSEMIVTVPEPYVVISNGKLLEASDVTGPSRTYHWLQKLPHPNYLMTLYVGNFERGSLAPAFNTIPLDYWVPRGKSDEGRYAFRNTTKMVEFFSQRFNYRYPWDKYDQIAVPDYAIGAMEHTSATGHRLSVLRTESAAHDFSPDLDYYTDPWSAEATISHELAHHWFGDLLTCRNLSYIWLNESFASFLMLLWDEESLGADQYLYSADLVRQEYFDYVSKEHIIRPLEYHNFDDSNTIYNTEHTYFKGAAILHMLRKVLGDDVFFGAMSYYLHKHEYANVVSNDLKIAIEEASGQNLDWFFDDWVTGGGHPILEIEYDYVPDRRQVVLSVEQVQPFVEGQGLFRLPVDVTIATTAQTWKERIWIEEDENYFTFESPLEPVMVSFDGAGDLVAEMRFRKNATELSYQALHDQVAGRLRAIRELAGHFPSSEITRSTFAKILESDSFWGVRAEAAYRLGELRNAAALGLVDRALAAPDYRVRKAAVLALVEFGKQHAGPKLRQVIKLDTQDDVVAAAIVALAKADPGLEPAFIDKLVSRDSWADEIRVACMRASEELENRRLLPTIKKYADHRYNQFVHGAAIDAWSACAPTDPRLHQVLLGLTKSPVYQIQQDAISKLGDLYVIDSRQRLEEIVVRNVDPNLVTAAKESLKKLARVK